MPSLDSNTLLDLSELFLSTQSSCSVGQQQQQQHDETCTTATTNNLTAQFELSSQVVAEEAESVAHCLILEAVDPVVVLGSASSEQRVSVITT